MARGQEECVARGQEEAKNELTQEMKEREERSGNIVVYGVPEKEGEDNGREADEKVLRELATEIGVEIRGKLEVRFRAGKRKEPEKPRPIVVKVEDDETREKLLTNARRLARKDEWKRIYVAPDMTWQQREESMKDERKKREEAEKKTEEAKNEGRKGKFVVVGVRGRRRIVWREERGEE